MKPLITSAHWKKILLLVHPVRESTFLILFSCYFFGSILSSCVSSQSSTRGANDDLYFSKKDAPSTPVKNSPPETYSNGSGNNSDYYNSDANTQNENVNQNNSSYDYYNNQGNSQSTQDGKGNTYITNNNYNGDYMNYDRDDYYDYGYSSRIRRFYGPYSNYGYYDPYFTNLYYYNNDPFCYGTSIYLGYSFWNPRPYGWSIGYNYGWGFGMGYNCFGYSPWGYSPYYSPWFNSYGFNNGYWNGYNHGYSDGFNNGLGNNYYYNSYDNNSHYKGPRGSSTGSGTGLASTGTRPLSQIYSQTVSGNQSQAAGGRPGINTNQGAGFDVKSKTDAPNNSSVKNIENNFGTLDGKVKDNSNRPSVAPVEEPKTRTFSPSSENGNVVRERPSNRNVEQEKPSNPNYDKYAPVKNTDTYSRPNHNNSEPRSTPESTRPTYNKPQVNPDTYYKPRQEQNNDGGGRAPKNESYNRPSNQNGVQEPRRTNDNRPNYQPNERQERPSPSSAPQHQRVPENKEHRNNGGSQRPQGSYSSPERNHSAPSQAPSRPSYSPPSHVAPSHSAPSRSSSSESSPSRGGSPSHSGARKN